MSISYLFLVHTLLYSEIVLMELRVKLVKIWVDKIKLKKSWILDRILYPTPVALITCVSREGQPNIITLAEVFMPCIRSPLTIGLAINPSRYSNSLIRETKEFVVNVPTADMVQIVDYCGTVSGRTVNKFEVTGLTPEPATQVKSPLIKECPVSIECKLIRVMPIGYHDFFMGEALAVHVDEKVTHQRRLQLHI